jgi:menaquinone-specific isochorismate synthase
LAPDLVWISPRIELYGWGRGARFDPGSGPQRYQRARAMAEEWWAGLGVEGSEPGPYAFASFTFDLDAPGSVVVIPAVILAVQASRSWTVAIDDLIPPNRPSPGAILADRPRFAGSSLPDHLWLEAVSTALTAIASGEIEKVVLARDHALWSKHPFDPGVILSRLQQRFPDCFTFLIEDLVGASPELLVRAAGLEVTSRVLAGSAPRSEDEEEDRRLGKALEASEKNLHEHLLAAASVGRVLGEVCRTLDRPAAPELLKLANLQHLSTTFEGTLAETRHVLDLVSALHPTAAVGGTPPGAALAMIRRLERMERGRYAGPIGYFDLDGDGEFAIALRCAELSGARARLFAGGGIVAGSVPEEELEETRLKLRAMLSVLE